MRETLIKLLGGFTPKEVEGVVEQLTTKPAVVTGFLTNKNNK